MDSRTCGAGLDMPCDLETSEYAWYSKPLGVSETAPGGCRSEMRIKGKPQYLGMVGGEQLAKGAETWKSERSPSEWR